jgi:hypothetical protein
MLAAVPAFAGAAPAQDSQPISTSLVECGAILAHVALSMADKGRPAADIGRAEAAMTAFVDEALVQASHEGVADPRRHIETLGVEMAAKWDDRFADLAKLSENMEWLDYCTALGESRNILPIGN